MAADRPRSLPSTLLDPEAERRLVQDGYVVVDLLEPAQIVELRSLCEQLHSVPRSTWESDFYSPYPADKRAAHEGIGSVFAEPVRRHFAAHRSVLHNFVVNWPGSDGGLVLHQHSTVVDPARFRSVILWCALNDADEDNGTLHVVPRSHLVQRGPRPERSASWHEPHTAELLADHLVSVPVRAGQALVFDNQLLHCSFPNSTSEPRLTAGAVVLPMAAEARFYELADDGRVDVHLLDPEFFLEQVAGDLEWARPTGLEKLTSEDWVPTVVTSEELPALVGPGTCPHPSPREPSPAPLDLAPPGPDRVTMADPVRQRELEEFGFTVVPDVLPPALLDAVRHLHARIGPAPDDPRVSINWTFHSASSEHKRAVQRQVGELAGRVLDAVLVDHVAYLTTFITKWPGPNSAFPPHQDPSLLDERRFRGVTVWIPLADTDERNGGLHLVPGSHRFSRQLRVSDVDRFPFAGLDREMVEHGRLASVRAGDALVFDNRVVHYSLPNTTDEPRVVLSFGVRPREAACIILRDTGPGELGMWEVHDDFYVDVLPMEHHLWQPAGEPVDRVAVVEERWTAQRLAQLCALVPPAPGVATRATGTSEGWDGPAVFCARCGGTEGLDGVDRGARNNAQLICPRCPG
ncbi:MAG: phytanoyl-CoA dioxygenase family protein [Microthrixaceae bacterium]